LQRDAGQHGQQIGGRDHLIFTIYLIGAALIPETKGRFSVIVRSAAAGFSQAG